MNMYDRISSNKRDSYILFLLFIILIAILGYVFGALVFDPFIGMAFFIVIAIIFSIFSYYKSDSIVLAISQAKPADEKQFAYLHNTVEGLSIAAGIPKPRVYVIDDTAMNAFASGRDPQHAVICVTTGLINRLNRVELEGVIAHEMSHIKNYDIRFMMYVTVMVGITALLADVILRSFLWGGARTGNRKEGGLIFIVIIVIGLLLAILTPIIAQLIKFAISRKREYLADADGAYLTKYPPGLASALKKLSADKEPLEAANKATAHLYIVNPMKNLKGTMNNLFSTHPPIEERIKALEAM